MAAYNEGLDADSGSHPGHAYGVSGAYVSSIFKQLHLNKRNRTIW